jgi:hypothetical protein
MKRITALVPNCLGEVFETHLAAAYHSDNLTHDGSPGDPSTWVVNLLFHFLALNFDNDYNFFY